MAFKSKPCGNLFEFRSSQFLCVRPLILYSCSCSFFACIFLSGLITPSGLTSIPAGMETPDMIELRKRKNIEEAMESGAEQQPLYTVLPEKRVSVGAAMMGSAHVYDMASVRGEVLY